MLADHHCRRRLPHHTDLDNGGRRSGRAREAGAGDLGGHDRPYRRHCSRSPPGTLIGGSLGWRAAIWAITGLGLLAGAAILVGVPRLPGRPRRGLKARLQPLGVSTIRRVLTVTLVGFVAVYLFYAYVSVVYMPLSADNGFLALILMVIGVAGIVGNLIAGALTDRYGARWVVTGVLLITAVAILAAGLSGTSRVLALTTAAAYGIAAWAITGPQQHRLLAADTGRTGLPVALNSSAMYLAIAIAGAVGGAFSATGHWPILITASIAALLATAISIRADAHRAPTASETIN